MYACGLRISEATMLEIGAIDRPNLVLRIVGKGNKERLAALPQPVLDELGRLWRTHHNRRWLFPNHRGDAPLNPRVLARTFAAAAAAAAPGPQVPAVDPAPVDVPAGAVGSPVPPSYPAYRRSPQQQWPLSEAPVPPATPSGASPATSDADARWAVPARAAAAGRAGTHGRSSRGLAQ